MSENIVSEKKQLSDKISYNLMSYTGFCTLVSWGAILSIMDFFEHFVSH